MFGRIDTTSRGSEKIAQMALSLVGFQWGVSGEGGLKAQVATIDAPHAVLGALAIGGVVGAGLGSCRSIPLRRAKSRRLPAGGLGA